MIKYEIWWFPICACHIERVAISKSNFFDLFTTVVSNVYISGCILAREIIFRYSCRELAAQQDWSLEIFFWLRGGLGGRVYPRPTRFFQFFEKVARESCSNMYDFILEMCEIQFRTFWCLQNFFSTKGVGARGFSVNPPRKISGQQKSRRSPILLQYWLGELLGNVSPNILLAMSISLGVY